MILLQIDVAERLVTTGRIRQQSIVILSPYNAQVSEIKEELKKKKLDQITVTTITKSQGDSTPVAFCELCNNENILYSKIQLWQ